MISVLAEKQSELLSEVWEPWYPWPLPSPFPGSDTLEGSNPVYKY